jgi:hypothetical protein
MAIGEPELAAFLGIDLGLSARAQEGGREYEGWPAAVGSPMVQALMALFPIQGGNASLVLAGDSFWCVAPEERRSSYHPAFFVALRVRGWQSEPQQLLAAGVPVPREGSAAPSPTQPGRHPWTPPSPEGRAPRAHVLGVVRRLKALSRKPDERARGLLPHDVWTAG